MKRFSSKEKGFTLIELLVVIAIIGLLSSVVLASLNAARAKGRDAARVSDIHQIQNALELYRSSNNNYPASIGSGNAPSLGSPYISKVSIDPRGNDGSACRQANSTSNGYCYAYNADRTAYHLAAQLETGVLWVHDAQFDSLAAGYTGGFHGDGSSDYIYDVKF